MVFPVEYLYAEQWSQAFNYSRQNAIDYVTITTWNEFPERTAIEPHFDATASSHDPYFLYNATRNYIAQLKGLDRPVYEAPKYWYQNPYAFVAIVAVVVIYCFVAIEVYKHY
jgi:hypothetical protein